MGQKPAKNQPPPGAVSETRFTSLDGLRGLASVAVFLWHNFLAFFPGATDARAASHSRFLEETLYRSPLSVFFAGDFAVYVFFVLSGFVISIKFFRSDGSDELKKSFLRRYVRLMPPAFLTVFVSYLLLSGGLIFSKPAGDILHSWWLELNWSAVRVSFPDMLWAGLYETWFAPPGAGQSFNSNLGTLSIEMIGSFVIFASIWVAKILKLSFFRRGVFYAALLAAAFYLTGVHPYYIVFFIGMAMADIYVHYPRIFRQPVWASGLVFAAGAFLGAVRDQNVDFAYYQPIVAVFRATGLHPVFYSWGLGAILMMYGLLANAALQKLFSAGWARMLGRYSYALFLTHTVFLGSVTCLAFLTLNNYWPADMPLVTAGAFFGTLPLLLVCVWMVERVDAKAVRLSRLF